MAEPRERREFEVKKNIHSLFGMRSLDGTSPDCKHYCTTYMPPVHLFAFVLEKVNSNIPFSAMQILSLVLLFFISRIGPHGVFK